MGALIAARRRRVFGWRQVAGSRASLRASAAISSTAPAPAAATATVSAATRAGCAAAVIAFAAAIGARRVLLGGIVLLPKILRGRSVGVRLTLLGGFRVRFVVLLLLV